MLTSGTPALTALQRLLKRLTQPLPTIQSEQERQQSYMLSLGSLVACIIGLVVLVVVVLFFPFDVHFIFVLFILSGMLLTYGLSRTHYYKVGKVAFNAVPLAFFIISIYFSPTSSTLILAVLTIYTAGVYSSVRYAAVNGVVSLTVALFMLGWLPGQWSDSALTLVALINIGIVSIFQTNLLRRMESSLVGQRNQLVKSQTRLRGALDSSLQMFLLLEAVRDASGKVIDFRLVETNPTAEKRFPFVLNGLMSEWSDAVMPLQYRQQFLRLYMSVLESREVIVSEVELPNHQWLEYQIVPVGDGVAVSSTDITDRKLAEEHRFELQAEKQRVDSLQRLLSNLSHDLNTPLSIIKTSAYLAQKMSDTDDPRLPGKLQQIDEQADRLDLMLKDMLSLSRMDELEESELNRSLTQPGDMLEQIVTSFQQSNQKEQSIQFIAAGTLPPLNIDRRLMEVALSNLLDNAVKYTPSNSQIEVSCRGVGQNFLIEVADNGPGIASRDLPFIFEQFYRGAVHRPTDGGAGLGLSLAKRIIIAHGGKITAENRPTGGALFRITLPLTSSN